MKTSTKKNWKEKKIDTLATSFASYWLSWIDKPSKIKKIFFSIFPSCSSCLMLCRKKRACLTAPKYIYFWDCRFSYYKLNNLFMIVWCVKWERTGKKWESIRVWSWTKKHQIRNHWNIHKWRKNSIFEWIFNSSPFLETPADKAMT